MRQKTRKQTFLNGSFSIETFYMITRLKQNKAVTKKEKTNRCLYIFTVQDIRPVNFA